MKKLLTFGLILVLTLSLLVGCGGGAAPDEGGTSPEEGGEATEAPALKVGFIYVGPIGDGGWTYAHDQGRLYLEEQLGVETTYVENVEENKQAVDTAARNLIDQGFNVIYATSFGYMDHIEALSAEFPEVTFLHCSGFKMTDNMSNYFGAMEEPRYLSGIVAGMKTESNEIGYVAAKPIPEVIRGINAFTLGVKSVNPDATVQVRWTNTWYDPAKEKEAAKALLDNECDVIAQHQDTTGPQLAAAEVGATAIGYNTDSSELVPDAYMTAPVWNWGPYYVDQVQKVMDGTWTAESYYGGMKDGIVELAPLTDLAPEGAQEATDEATAAIIDGSLNIFEGPINDQDGAEKVAEGQVLTLEELLSMEWFVEGVEGSIQ